MKDQVSYLTKTGDMLDRICWEYYGARAGAFEQVLAANPGLAKHGPVYPSGIRIVLPELPAQESTGTISLWD